MGTRGPARSPEVSKTEPITTTTLQRYPELSFQTRSGSASAKPWSPRLPSRDAPTGRRILLRPRTGNQSLEDTFSQFTRFSRKLAR